MIDTCGLFVGCLLTCSSDEETLTVELVATDTGTHTIEYYFLENVIRFEIEGTLGVPFEIPGQYFNEYGNARIKIVNPDGTYFTHTVDGVIYETFYLVVKQTVDANFIPSSGSGSSVVNHDATLVGDGSLLTPLGVNTAVIATKVYADAAALAAADDWGTQVVEHDATLTGDGTVGNPLEVDTSVIATQVYADNAALAAADDWGAQVVEHDGTLTGDGTIGTPLGVDVSVIATQVYADNAAAAAADDWGSDVVNHDTSLTGNGTAGTPLTVNTAIIATQAYADAAAAAVAYTDEQAQDAIGAMVDASLNYVDGTPLLQRAALTGAITALAGDNATLLGSFTKAQLDAAVSDGNVLYVGDVGIGAGLAFGTDNQIPFTNAAGTNLDYSPNLTFDGTALSVDNSTVIFNESGADVDFRIESDGNAGMFFLDGGNNRVGIGTASPGFTLDIAGTARIASASSSRLEIWAGSASGGLSLGADVNLATRSVNVRKVGIISAPDFANTSNIELFSLNSPDASTNTLSFGGRSGGSNTGATELNFITNATPATTGGTVRLYVASDGKLGMGITSPQTNLHLQESNTDTIPTIEIEQLSTGDAGLQFSIAGDSFAMGIDNSDNDLFKISYAAAEGTAVLGTGDVLTLDGAGLLSTTRVSVPDGSAALPSIKVGDEQNGLFSSAANQLGFTINGSQRAVLSGSTFVLAVGGGGSPVRIAASNLSNTSGSSAEIQALAAGASGGDPFSSYIITSGASWSLGADNSDSDAFVISEAATLGTNNRFRIATGGAAQFFSTVRLFGYTVATLPAGTIGMTAYVTDSLAPAWNVAVAGGGAVVVKVFYNGAAWVCG